MLIFPVEPNSSEAGFTLLELMVALAITSMILASTPSIYASLVPNVRVRQFANDIANKARSMRQLAKSDGQTHVLAFVDGANSLVLDGDVVTGPYDLAIDYSPMFAWKQSSQNIIEFYPDGSTSGGTISFNRDNVIVLVEIDWVSGSVTVKQ